MREPVVLSHVGPPVGSVVADDAASRQTIASACWVGTQATTVTLRLRAAGTSVL